MKEEPYLAERSSRRWGLSTTLSHISFRIRCALAFLSLDSTTDDSFEGPAKGGQLHVVSVQQQQSLDYSPLSVVHEYLVWWRCSALGWSQWRQWWGSPQQGLKWSQCHHLVKKKSNGRVKRKFINYTSGRIRRSSIKKKGLSLTKVNKKKSQSFMIIKQWD